MGEMYLSLQPPITQVELNFKLKDPHKRINWGVVVAQLVERTLPTPEIYSSNPDIGEILSTNCIIEKTKIKKKRPAISHLFKLKDSQMSC